MLFLLFYFLPIIIIGFIVYYDMEHGQTLREYVKANDFEVPAVFTCVPALNILVLVVCLGMVVWNIISNFKKP